MIALFGWTTTPIVFETNLEISYSKFTLILCFFEYRHCRAITNSSNEAFPALSPSPLMVTCAQEAPEFIAAIEFATASPKSLWQCTLIGVFIFDLSSCTNDEIYSGVEYPTVSGISILSAPESVTALKTSIRNFLSDLVASSAENSTFNP